MSHIEKLARYREHLLRLLRHRDSATARLQREHCSLLSTLALLNAACDKAHKILLDLAHLPKGHAFERSRKLIRIRHNLLCRERDSKHLALLELLLAKASADIDVLELRHVITVTSAAAFRTGLRPCPTCHAS
jgi:hypothetical protein